MIDKDFEQQWQEVCKQMQKNSNDTLASYTFIKYNASYFQTTRTIVYQIFVNLKNNLLRLC